MFSSYMKLTETKPICHGSFSSLPTCTLCWFWAHEASNLVGTKFGKQGHKWQESRCCYAKEMYHTSTIQKEKVAILLNEKIARTVIQKYSEISAARFSLWEMTPQGLFGLFWCIRAEYVQLHNRSKFCILQSKKIWCAYPIFWRTLIWLVVWNMYHFSILDTRLPTDFCFFFQRGT